MRPIISQEEQVLGQPAHTIVLRLPHTPIPIAVSGASLAHPRSDR